MNEQILAIGVLIASYVVLFSEKLNRAVAVLLGASVLIFSGVLSHQAAVSSIDFNTIALLIGMMIVVGIAEKSGMFQALAVLSAKAVRANPRGLLIMLALITAVLSALLDNVTTVLLIVPVTFQMMRHLKLNAYPFLLVEIFASNIGGTATLIGDPPNILIGSALELSFMDFVYKLFPVVAVCMVVLIAVFDFAYGRHIKADVQSKAELLKIGAKEMITDFSLFYKSLCVLTGVLSLFILAEKIHLQNGTIALLGAFVMLFLYTFGDEHLSRDQRVEDAFSLVDWTTIFFFCGLFIVVFGLEKTGVLEILGQKFILVSQGSIKKATFGILWISAVVSGAIDNIPFVATMIPTLKSMEESFGGRVAMMPVWWALSLGSCFGGNGSLIGASANVIVAGLALRENEHIGFVRFLLWGVPVMFVSVICATIYLYLLYFM
ncbi:MAG: ArsB/NhaD family transporter [Alphaproteobacteria bacterium]|nr:ArsB/NhaD family transporter [Alphaproteobacteria bacterium]